MPHQKFKYKGKDLPSVTEVLAPYDKRWLKWFYKKYGSVERAEAYSSLARERGSRIHEAYQMYLEKRATPGGALEMVAPEEEKSLQVLMDWSNDMNIKPLLVEKHVVNKEDLYHGTLDYVMTLDKSKLSDTDFWGHVIVDFDEPSLYLADLKTKEDRKPSEAEIKTYALQLSAYAQALKKEGIMEVDTGLVICLDVVTAEVTPILITNLETFYPVFLKQKEISDYINGSGKWLDLKRRRGKHG